MMTNTFSERLAVPLAALLLAGFAWTPAAHALGERGGGGRAQAAGAGARANAAGGGGRQAVQANSARADARTNDVRSTSVNNVNSRNTNVNASRNTNVNASRNVNVNVSGNNCCGNGWDNDYHPVAGAMAVAGAVAVTSAVVGSIVNTVPPSCVPVNYGGMVYQQCGSQWYQPQGSQYVVVNPPY
ncbi:hypothetical protein SAMN05444680_1245 [Variovorax sp. YR216]|nr:hypothetical protein SAMN05444680_1245 [Variovorax sp. YR216]